MEHNKIFKRDDGTRVRIIVSYDSGNQYASAIYSLMPTSNFSFRGKYWKNVCSVGEDEEKQLEHVTKEEMLQAKLELWEKMKPTIEVD